MSQTLSGQSVAILVTDGFEQEELTEPKAALEEAGALVHIVSPKADRVKGWNFGDWGDEFAVDVPLRKAFSEHYDALVLPGGVMNPDSLRTNSAAIDFIRAFFTEGKVVAAICHGPWTLIEAGVVRLRDVTSYPSIKTDLENAGAKWIDQEVVVDDRLVTSRKPDDLPAFNRTIVERLAAATSQHHTAA